ncbi:MAG: ribonuclease D, partial [Miltoncostaeaceae bacterium]
MAAPQPIRDAAGVAEVVGSARASGRMALDFEFLWERTYAPVPCLAQVNVDGEIALIDPVQGAPLEPLAEVLDDPSVTVVMHAPSADLTLMALATGVAPTNLVDVQVTAGFVGLGAGQGLAALLERVLRVQLDKGERYTDWSRRPLSEAQNTYAAADVEHLLELSDRLDERAERLGRSEWV